MSDAVRWTISLLQKFNIIEMIFLSPRVFKILNWYKKTESAVWYLRMICVDRKSRSRLKKILIRVAKYKCAVLCNNCVGSQKNSCFLFQLVYMTVENTASARRKDILRHVKIKIQASIQECQTNITDRDTDRKNI